MQYLQTCGGELFLINLGNLPGYHGLSTKSSADNTVNIGLVFLHGIVLWLLAKAVEGMGSQHSQRRLLPPVQHEVVRSWQFPRSRLAFAKCREGQSQYLRCCSPKQLPKEWFVSRSDFGFSKIACFSETMFLLSKLIYVHHNCLTMMPLIHLVGPLIVHLVPTECSSG